MGGHLSHGLSTKLFTDRVRKQSGPMGVIVCMVYQKTVY
jgi:hypothetical protein